MIFGNLIMTQIKVLIIAIWSLSQQWTASLLPIACFQRKPKRKDCFRQIYDNFSAHLEFFLTRDHTMVETVSINGPLYQLGVFFLLISTFFHDMLMLRLMLSLGFAMMQDACGFCCPAIVVKECVTNVSISIYASIFIISAFIRL